MKQKILAIETTSPQLSLAVGEENHLLASYHGPLQWRHAETLFEGMETLLRKVHWTIQEITGVLVSAGPGSFTGIRIGLAVARTLGQTLKIPVVGISSLETLAYGAVRKRGTQDSLICPQMDALRGEVFTALFMKDERGLLKRIWKDQRIPRELLRKRLADLRQKGRQIHGLSGDAYPEAEAMLLLGGPRLFRASKDSYRRVLPTYLRQAAAQERRHTA